MTALDWPRVLGELRRPMLPQSVRWKIQVNPRSERSPATIVGYIDARLVAERLNAAAPGWEDCYTPIQVGQQAAFVTCRLKVLDRTREDVGHSPGVIKDMDAKAVYSDAFKRAAVKFGVGSFLYAMPEIKIFADKLESWSKGDKTFYKLGDSALKDLDERYARWVSRPAVKERFGDPRNDGVVVEGSGGM